MGSASLAGAVRGQRRALPRPGGAGGVGPERPGARGPRRGGDRRCRRGRLHAAGRAVRRRGVVPPERGAGAHPLRRQPRRRRWAPADADGGHGRRHRGGARASSTCPRSPASVRCSTARRTLLVTCPEALDLPGPRAANVRYVGPVLEDAGPDAGWHPPGVDDGRPLVVVGLGTTPMDEGPVLQRLLTALGDAPARVVATLGDHLDAADAGRAGQRPPERLRPPRGRAAVGIGDGEPRRARERAGRARPRRTAGVRAAGSGAAAERGRRRAGRGGLHGLADVADPTSSVPRWCGRCRTWSCGRARPAWRLRSMPSARPVTRRREIERLLDLP